MESYKNGTNPSGRKIIKQNNIQFNSEPSPLFPYSEGSQDINQGGFSSKTGYRSFCIELACKGTLLLLFINKCNRQSIFRYALTYLPVFPLSLINSNQLPFAFSCLPRKRKLRQLKYDGKWNKLQK